jgi:hypothetical protein
MREIKFGVIKNLLLLWLGLRILIQSRRDESGRSVVDAERVVVV